MLNYCNKTTALCLWMLMSVSAPVEAVEWQKLYSDDTQEIFMNIDSARVRRGTVQVWLRTRLKEKRNLSDYETFQSYIKHKVYNCTSGIAMTDKVVLYENPDWTGRVIFEKEDLTNQYEEFDLIPTPFSQKIRTLILDKICHGVR